jgi:small conductance mechanosensitive channel
MPDRTFIIELAVRYGFQVLGALVVIALGVLAARWIGGFADQRMRKSSLEPPMRILLVRMIRVVVLAIAVVMALDQVGFQVAPLIAGIGVAGIGVGFALQGVLSNIVAGLTIIVTKPFRVGEYIEVAGVQGEVKHIDLPSTILLHADQSKVVVPNRKIVGEILHNYGMIRQLKLTISVGDAGDLNSALAAVQDVLARNARVLKDPTPVVGVSAINESGIRVAVMPWTRDIDAGPVEAELYQALLEDFRTRSIGLGVTRRDIRVINGTAVAATPR